MGRPLPGVALEIIDDELVLTDPGTDPTFFVGYLDGDAGPEHEPWRTGDRVQRDEDGYLFFEGRTDDVIISAGYRIGPFEVESALVSHDAVAEAAVVAAPDDERGAVVRAVVVLRDGFAASDELAAELQDHVKRETAPYKYPRIVDFAAELPKTASGKVQRALLRAVLSSRRLASLSAMSEIRPAIGILTPITDAVFGVWSQPAALLPDGYVAAVQTRRRPRGCWSPPRRS